MATGIKAIVKIELKPNSSFNQRERTINEQVQKNIDSFSSKGYITISHKINNKTEKFASVEFILQPMIKS
jgi:chorismate synthase